MAVRRAHWEGGSTGRLPLRLTTESAEGERSFRCYFWTITHGGNHRSDDEYRIQALLAGGERRLDFGGVTTVLLGIYLAQLDGVSEQLGRSLPDADAEVIVAWDPTLHAQLGLSSSCQVSFGQIEMAHLRGIAVQSRSVDLGQTEDIVAMRPEFFGRYLQTAIEGHNPRVWRRIGALEEYRGTTGSFGAGQLPR